MWVAVPESIDLTSTEYRSSPGRRLGDNTQVFPLERNEHVHNRLTHSYEVSNLARSIGAHVSPLGARIVDEAEGARKWLRRAGTKRRIGCFGGHWTGPMTSNCYRVAASGNFLTTRRFATQ